MRQDYYLESGCRRCCRITGMGKLGCYYFVPLLQFTFILEVFPGDTSANGKFLIEVSNLSHLNRIIEKVRRVKGVIEVHRSRRYDQGQ